MKELMKEAIETVKQNWNDFINALSDLCTKVKTFFSKQRKPEPRKPEPRKPKDIYEFIEQKKKRKPFYKDDRNKMWE